MTGSPDIILLRDHVSLGSSEYQDKYGGKTIRKEVGVLLVESFLPTQLTIIEYDEYKHKKAEC